MAKADMYLKMEPFEGSSKHLPNEMDVVSWSWGMTQRTGDTGIPVGKSSVHPMTIVKVLDGATSNLAKQCCDHEKKIPKAVLTCFRAPDKEPYLVITLERVVITSVELGGHGGSEEPTETLSLTFGKYTVKWRKDSRLRDSSGLGRDFEPTNPEIERCSGGVFATTEPSISILA